MLISSSKFFLISKHFQMKGKNFLTKSVTRTDTIDNIIIIIKDDKKVH